MATREENLKKINAELEMMSDEQLDRVVGGSTREIAGDSRFLNDLAGLCTPLGDIEAFDKYRRDYPLIKPITQAAWKKVGIDVDFNGCFIGSDFYFLNGKQIERSEAFKYACAKYGKKLEDMHGDYNL